MKIYARLISMSVGEEKELYKEEVAQLAKV